MRCLRDEPRYKGRCPVADDAPRLAPANETAAAIYGQAQGSAVQIAAEDKNYHYLRPADVEALMNIHGVEPDERPGVLAKVLGLQDLANQLRAGRPKKLPWTSKGPR